MWIAKQEHRAYSASVRVDGRFTDGSLQAIISAVMEWGWPDVAKELAISCQNRAAVACLDNRDDLARLWLDRAKKLKEIT